MTESNRTVLRVAATIFLMSLAVGSGGCDMGCSVREGLCEARCAEGRKNYEEQRACREACEATNPCRP